MRCPVCNEKIKKKSGVCPGCGFRVPPEPSFIEKLMFLPIPEILFGLIIVAGIGLLFYRLAMPSDHQEPIINARHQMEIDSDVGVVFFDNADNELTDQISTAIEKLDISEDCEIKYKYGTDEQHYEEVVSSLISDNDCKNIIITDNVYYSTLTDIANKYTDVRFFVLWSSDEYNETPPENVQICHVDISKAVNSIGINSAHKLTEMIKNIDVTDPQQSGINHTAVFLYKTEYGYSFFEQFAAGVKQINPNLSIYAVNVDNEAEYAKELAESEDVYAIMAADEMPELTKVLSENASDKIFLSGISEDVTEYPNYLCTITIDHSTYINHIFNIISKDGALTPVFEGRYDDSFCRLKYNTDTITK